MGKNSYVFVWLLLGVSMLGTLPAQAQPFGQYLLVFRDKANNPYSVGQPTQFLSARSVARRQRQNIAVAERDLPVTPAYVQGLRQAGARVLYTSRWLNAALVEAQAAQIPTLLALPYVLRLETGRVLNNVNARRDATATPANARKFGTLADVPAYGQSGFQLRQIGVDKMHEQGYRGEGMLVGVLDSGFLNANRVPFLSPLFSENRVMATYDFPDREADVYDDDSHGLSVLSVMAGESPARLYGPAFKASYVLLRTEVAATENPVEEAYWLFGAEYADSVGVDVINSSLGYYVFDNPADNHPFSDLNGQTTIVTRAATWAAQAGIVVVNSAGNEGGTSWQSIIAPADSPGVLAIGAVTTNGLIAGFSSTGPSADGRIKPDLVALGNGTVVGTPGGSISTSNGTSFSSPLVAALAAGFWQANPSLTAAQVRDCLRQSGSQANQPDNTYGYGLPNYNRATAIALLRYSADAPLVTLFPNPITGNEPLSVFWREADPLEPVSVQVTNLTGQVILQQQCPSAQSFNLSPVGVGTYLLTMTTATRSRTVRFIRL